MAEGSAITARTDTVRVLTEPEALKLSISESDSEAFAQLMRRKGGGIADTFSNYLDVVAADTYLKGKFSLNALDGRAYIEPTFWDAKRHPVRNEDRGRIREFLSRVYGIEKKEMIDDAINLESAKHKFHPITEYLANLKWDGVLRIRRLFPRYLGAEESDFTEAVTRLLLCGAIERVRNPGTKFDCCVILSDTEQGTGKSSICRFLALKDEWFTDDLDNLEDTEKAFETIRGHWIVELGEMLATRKTKDVEAIKSFVSRQADTYREKYTRFSEDFPRQCIFIGTSNKPAFLPADPTGNRRFLPVICDYRKREKHPLEDEQETREFIKQCYAEALAYIEEHGAVLTLDRRFDVETNEIRESVTPENTKVGMIQNWLDRTVDDVVCSRLIWDKVFSDDGKHSPKSFDLQEISELMNLKITGWERYKGKDGTAKNPMCRFHDFGLQRAWQRVKKAEVFTAVNNDEEGVIPFL